MTKILGIGDNTVDIYIDKGIQYPGGNALNVAVLTKRLGVDSSYLGCIGQDSLGAIVEDALRAEEVDISHIRRLKDQPTSWSRVRHQGNDRYFDGSLLIEEGCYDLQKEDYEFIAEHDLSHTSVYSKIENDLSEVSKVAPLLSFDYSDKYDSIYLEKTAPQVDIAFLSNANEPKAACEELCRQVSAYGPSVVVITRGEQGSVAYEKNAGFSYGEIVTGDIVDTLGAGDGFISGFLVAHLSGKSVGSCLEHGASYATVICGKDGGFGYGAKIMPNQPGLVIER